MCAYAGPVDGRRNRAFVESIKCFQRDHEPTATDTLHPRDPQSDKRLTTMADQPDLPSRLLADSVGAQPLHAAPVTAGCCRRWRSSALGQVASYCPQGT